MLDSSLLNMENTKQQNNPITVVSNVADGDSRMTLCLTYIRTSQQKYREKIHERRMEMRGKAFRVHMTKPRFCGSQNTALINYVNNRQVIKYSTVPCRSWTCPDCGPKKALTVKYYLRDIIQLNTLSRFLTLTLDPKKIPIEYLHETEIGFRKIQVNHTHRYITKLLNHFLVIIKRRYVNKSKTLLKYVWVVEFQQNGMAHIHMVINQFLPIKLLRYEWSRIGGGVQMNISKVKTIVGVSNYIGNYIVKGLKTQYELKDQKGGFKYNERRYSVSQSCVKPEKNKVLSLNKMSEADRNTLIKLHNLEDVYNTLKSETI